MPVELVEQQVKAVHEVLDGRRWATWPWEAW